MCQPSRIRVRIPDKFPLRFPVAPDRLLPCLPLRVIAWHFSEHCSDGTVWVGPEGDVSPPEAYVAVPPIGVLGQARDRAVDDIHVLVDHLNRFWREAPLSEPRPLTVCCHQKVKLMHLAVAQADLDNVHVIPQDLINRGTENVLDIGAVLASVVENGCQVSTKDLVFRCRVNGRAFLERKGGDGYPIRAQDPGAYFRGIEPFDLIQHAHFVNDRDGAAVEVDVVPF